jgi:hypothetical protein
MIPFPAFRIPKADRLSSRAPLCACLGHGVAPAQQSASFDVLARIQPEAERTLAFAHGLGERGETAMVVGIAQSPPVPSSNWDRGPAL